MTSGDWRRSGGGAASFLHLYRKEKHVFEKKRIDLERGRDVPKEFGLHRNRQLPCNQQEVWSSGSRDSRRWRVWSDTRNVLRQLQYQAPSSSTKLATSSLAPVNSPTCIKSWPVKVFLSDFDAAALESATRKVLEELGVSELDSLIVAFPPSAKSSTEKVRPLWAAAEQIYREGLALSVGVSDLDTAQLRDLHSWAEVKPSVNQVNLDSCCVIPQEMQEFAKANNIQLLTHSDPKVLLDHEGMARVLKGYMAEEDIRHWSAPWVARYSVLVKCRGFLQSKGYIASLVKEP
ncbi:glutamate-cysteine ligase modifier subunit isoform X1 [Rhipicephalus microplus]|uniref:glutamate-cysteine ligase modifier subunit isoform X1 n=1 Tax=Rhipicephalus microplus TaxID=6941 RepID=UPI003F6B613B